jgi:hypothetical protein
MATFEKAQQIVGKSEGGYQNTEKGCLAAVRQILLANLPQECYK